MENNIIGLKGLELLRGKEKGNKKEEISTNQAILGILNVLVQDMEFMRKQQELANIKLQAIEETIKSILHNQKIQD